MRKSLLFALVLATSVAVALAHFEDGSGDAPAGAVPAPGSETTVGDPEEDPGFDGPEPGSAAAEEATAVEGGDATEGGDGDEGGAEDGEGGDAAAAEGEVAGEGEGDDDGADAAAAAAAAAGGAAAAGAAGAAGAAAAGSGDDEDEEAATNGAVETPVPGTADPSASASSEDEDDEDAAAAADDDDEDATPEPSASDEDDEDDASSRDGDASDEDDGSVCFPGSATVLLESGATKTMEELNVGDRVHVGRGQFSDVFMFTHKLADVTNKFVALETESGAALRLTASHYIYANGELQAAKAISVGDVVELANGGRDTVSSVATVVDTGLFNPQTVHGDVVVDGVLASTYTTTVEPAFAHAVLSPLRAVYNALGFATTSLEHGSSLDVVLPSGAATSVV